MRHLVRFGGTLVLLAATLGQSGAPVDPREILRESDKALREVKEVVYSGESWASGGLSLQLGRLRGRVALRESQAPRANMCRVDLEFPGGKPDETHKLAIACDGQHVTLVDDARRVYGREALPKGKIVIDSVGAILLSEFCSATPLSDELAGPEVRYDGEEKVGGEDCQIVFVKYADESGSTARWFFSKKDHLPRRVERTMDSAAGPTTLYLVLSAIDTKPALDSGTFQLVKPKDYDEVKADRWSGPPKVATSQPTSQPAAGTATSQPAAKPESGEKKP